MHDVLDFLTLEPHRTVVSAEVDDARRHPAVIGILLIGSLGRGNAIPGSDVDILYLLEDGRGDTRLFANHERHGMLVEGHFRDTVTATAQMEREPSWYYAYLNSRILYDPTGRLATLVAAAHAGYAAYRAPADVKRRYAFLVDRTRHKLQAALDANDALRAGGIASTYASGIFNGLWTAYDRPPLTVSEMWMHLHTLFLGRAMERAAAGIAICAFAVPRLGGPIIDPYAI